MARYKVVNPKTGRRVFKTGKLGQEIVKEQKKKKTAIDKKKQKKNGTQKKDKCTYITFKYPAAMIPAQDMMDAGFASGKVIAICVWDNNKKKVLTERDGGKAYWSSKNV